MKVSVIVPYYNNPREQLLSAVESVLDQNYQDFELIIVDDGSAENYQTVLDEAASMDPRVRIVRQQNAGVSAARNHGIKKASGDYVVFLDADDVVAPKFLSEGVQLLERDHLDFLIGGVRIVKDLPNSIRDIKDREEEETIPKEDGDIYIIYTGNKIRDLRKQLIITHTTFDGGYIGRGPVSRFLKTEIARSCLFHTDLVIGEDNVWNLELLTKCFRIGVYKKVWYYYYINKASATHCYEADCIEVMKRFLRRLRKTIVLSNDEEYFQYCISVASGLDHIYNKLLSRKEWNVSAFEKQKTIRKLYTEMPWRILAGKRCFQVSDTRNRLKWLLYRCRLYYVALWLQKILKKEN